MSYIIKKERLFNPFYQKNTWLYFRYLCTQPKFDFSLDINLTKFPCSVAAQILTFKLTPITPSALSESGSYPFLHLRRRFGTSGFLSSYFNYNSHLPITGWPTMSDLAGLTQESHFNWSHTAVCYKHYFLFFFFLLSKKLASLLMVFSFSKKHSIMFHTFNFL